MKVYVIKNEQGKYQTPDMSFISSIWQADLFNDYEIAKCYCERDCEIIECELMQATELSDYTKQVRKEVCEEIRRQVEMKADFIDLDYCYGKGMLGILDLIEPKVIFDILNRIQGDDK